MKRNWNFVLLIQGIAANSLGSQFFNMIAILWLTEVADSGSLVGFFQFAGAISIAVCTPLGGVLADRFPRRNIIILASFCSGFTIMGLVSLFYLSDVLTILIAGFFVVNILLGIVGSFFVPSVFSLLPDILPPERLGVGNAVMRTTLNVSQIVGRACCGLLFTLLGVPLVIAIAGVSFLLSGVLDLFISLPKHEENDAQASEAADADTKKSVMAEILQGFNYVFAQKGLSLAFLVMIGMGACLGILMVNTPFLVKYHFKADLFWYGYFLACLSAGFIAGSVYAGVRFNHLEGISSRANLFVVSIIACPILCLCLGFLQQGYFGLPLFFLIGATYSVGGATVLTQLQMMVPNYIRGRVMSIGAMIFTVVSPLSGFVAGILIDVLAKDVVLLQWSSSVVIAALIYPLLMNKKLRIFIGSHLVEKKDDK